MDSVGEHEDEMWDEADGFFYDILRHPDGHATRLKLRSMVGLLPLCATTVIEDEYLVQFPETRKRVEDFLNRHPELCDNITSLRDPRGQWAPHPDGAERRASCGGCCTDARSE